MGGSQTFAFHRDVNFQNADPFEDGMTQQGQPPKASSPPGARIPRTLEPRRNDDLDSSTAYGPLIVGVGGAEGSEGVLNKILRSLGDGAGIAVLYRVHRGILNGTEFAAGLIVGTSFRVVWLEDDTVLSQATIYLVPFNSTFEIVDGRAIRAQRDGHPLTGNPDDLNASVTIAPIDHMLQSLARDQQERGVGVILSGPGSDGAQGLKAISDQGGLTFVQSPDSARYDSMPRNAAASGVADHVLQPTDIGYELARYKHHLAQVADPSSMEHLRQEIVRLIPEIAQQLVRVTEHNFQHYKKTTLSRRILRRMQVLRLSSSDKYLEMLKESEAEAHSLFRELLIGVTSFFRDPDAFETLRNIVLPNIFEGRSNADPVRIWVAGCASGEEAYSMAILCREYMDGLADPPDVRIFATDIDQRALQVARQGIYTIGIEGCVSSDRLKRFFVRRGKRYQASKEIRDLILFSPHNLISDPPFSRQDLISCRNLLIYLGSHLQNKLIPLFHYSLRPSGYLFQGPSESIASHGELFRQLDTKHRISQRKGTSVGSAAGITFRSGGVPTLKDEDIKPDGQVDLTNMMQKIVLDEFAPKAVVIDENGQVLSASADMEKYLSITSGRFQNNIIKMARSGLRIGLRSLLLKAKTIRRKVQHENVSVRVGDSVQHVMLTVQPMPTLGEDASLFLVVFQDLGLPVPLHDDGNGNQKYRWEEGGDVHSIIAQLERELETTRDDLEKTMQDMETANEELKSSNEELISMNEELQSANEELEASKEQIRSGSNALTRANNDLENLLRSTQIATIFLDEQLLIRSFTPAVTELYDLIASDIGRPLSRFMPLADNMPALPNLSELDEKDPVEDLIIANSGKAYIRRVLPYISQSGNPEGMVITFLDVTALRESENRLSLALDAASNGSWDWQIRENTVFLSDQWLSELGYDKSEVEVNVDFWRDCIHPEDRELVESALSDYFDGRADRYYCEFRLRAASGEYRWNLGRGRLVERGPNSEPLRMVGTDTDITARKLNESNLIQNERRLAMALKAAGMAAWEWNENQTYWTDELYDLIGVSKTVKPHPERFFEVIHEADRLEVERAWKALAEGQDVFEVEFRIVLPDQSVRWIVGVGEVIRNSEGSPTQIFGLNWDSTKEHLAAEALRDSERKATQANLSKSEFLANMSHEIRTPMTAILGYLDLLSEGETDPVKLQYFQTIRRNGDFLLQIINDILDLSKIEANKIDVERERFAPQRLVEDVRSIMEVRAKESNLDLDVQYRGKLPAKIVSDPKRVKQILINLVGNAVKFTEVGKVEIVVEFDDVESPCLKFEVIDTGIGMTAQQKASLFQPFSQGDSSVNRKFGGTGLGLAISKRLATMLGGSIQVESELGKGSKFTVRIATGDVSAVEFIEPTITVETEDLTEELENLQLDCRILVVDDRREIRFLSQRLLSKAGASVSEAEDGQHAIELVQQATQDNEPFQLILLDMQMPKLDGYSTARKLRELGYGYPIVALTADAMQGDMNRCIESGCNAYLSKPIDTKRLLQLVAQFTT